MTLKLLQVFMNAMVGISAQFKTLSAKLTGRKRYPSTRLNVFLLISLPTMTSFYFFIYYKFRYRGLTDELQFFFK